MKLSQLLESIEVLESYNDQELEINQIVCNSKKAHVGDLFVCIKGYQTDGHRYIQNAIDQGVIAIVVEDYQENLPIPQYVVENSRIALAAMADTFYGHPSRALKMIGITATNGKTTTSFMLNDLLERHGIKTGLIGTVMVKYGDFSEAAYLTTPESLDLHHFLYEMKKQEVTHVCMEVSSSALELNRVGNVDFDIVTLNNISREHIDLHGSFEQYFSAKASLIRNAEPYQWVVLNLDDAYSASLVHETKGRVLTFGIDHPTGDFWCKNVDLSTGRAKFTVEIMKTVQVGTKVYQPGEYPFELRTPGYHSVYNAMVAIMVGLVCEVPFETIGESLRTFGGVERRFEIVFEDDFMIVDDHFANAGNIDVTLKTLEKMDYKNLKLVYAIRGSRGATVIREAAEAIVAWAPKLGIQEVIASLSKSHITWKDVVTQEELDIFSEIMDKGGIKMTLHDELPDAIAQGLSEVGKGDVMMLAGCQGMDFGAKVALDQIHYLRPDIDAMTLFEPLEKRVAGV